MIGVTLGDPAGVGPEIVAKSLPSLKREELVLVGNEENFLRVLSALNLDEREKSVRSVLAKMESGFIRRLMEFQRE